MRQKPARCSRLASWPSSGSTGASAEVGTNGRLESGEVIGGERDEVSEQTNVVPFPMTVRGVRPLAGPASDPMPTKYEFTAEELAALCRWFSAMKYAFPGTEGVMMVSHQEN